MILVGVIIGYDAFCGYLFGCIIATAYLMFSGIIIGQVLENSRIFNEGFIINLISSRLFNE